MTLDEAKKVAEIFESADGGCPDCAAQLMYKAEKEFPEFEWIWNKNCCSSDNPNYSKMIIVKERRNDGTQSN